MIEIPHPKKKKKGKFKKSNSKKKGGEIISSQEAPLSIKIWRRQLSYFTLSFCRHLKWVSLNQVRLGWIRLG